MTQLIDPHHFDKKARRIRAQVSTILTKWGLLPRFKRWRLTQDPGTGMIVLFGILNNKYIATHTPIPFSNYFDPRLLHDLANELKCWWCLATAMVSAMHLSWSAARLKSCRRT